MSDWKKVGDWLKKNGGKGVALIGSLVSGNAPGAVAAAVSLISSATGTDDPTQALEALQTSPDNLVKLKELYFANEADIRRHHETMTRLELEDKQAEHHETQETIRAGDRAEDVFVRRTRPAQSWLSLFAGLYYVIFTKDPSFELALILFTLPWAYAGLREVGKGVGQFTNKMKGKGA